MAPLAATTRDPRTSKALELAAQAGGWLRMTCLLYTSPSPRD